MPLLTALPDGARFDCAPGETVLEAALRNGVSFAHACGGRARCSTCRIRILDGEAEDPPPGPDETELKARLALGPRVRLACRFRPRGDASFRRLVVDDTDLALANQLLRREPARAGELRAVAVMFFDVAGFTELAARLPPYDVLYLLNRFFARAAALLERRGGYFDKAIGDGFVAIFGLRGGKDAPLRAVAAALDILAEVDRGRPVLRRLYGADFDARIGLAWGEALIGTLGPPGAERLTAIGEIPNLASRAEQANKEAGTRLLVTETLWERIADKAESPDFIRVRLRGGAERITLREISALTPEAQAALRDAPPAGASSWTRACAAEELPEGALRVVPTQKRDIVLTRRDGRLLAFNQACPHLRLPFFGAAIPAEKDAPPVPGDSAFADGPRIVCRWHGATFDLTSGEIISWCPMLRPDGTAPGHAALGDLSKNQARLEVFPCREAEGAVWIAAD